MAEGGTYDGYLERAEITDPHTIDLMEYEHRARYLWASGQLERGGADPRCCMWHGAWL